MRISWHAAIIAALLAVFIIAGAGFIPLFGPQEDETLFTPTALPGQCGLSPGFEIAGRHIPLMLMSYVGALKGWIYKPVFAIWEPSVWSLRIPALLIAALAIFVTTRVLALAAGPAAGVIIAALLATDASYLLTSVFDWGPVAIQHLLLASAAYFFLRFQSSAGAGNAFLAGLLTGLALWNKMIAIWFLAGLGAGLLTCYPRSIAAWLRPRIAAAALGGVLLGAAPLIAFNLAENWPTIRENASMEKPELWNKALMVRITLEGSVMFGYLFDEVEGGESIRRGFRSSLLPYALLLAIPAGLILATRQTLFLLIAGIVAWLFMVTSRGGGAAHHAVLLAPVPHAIVAIAAARLLESRTRLVRLAAAAGCLAAAVSGLLVIQHYRVSGRTSTGGPGWTNALFELGRQLQRYPDRWVVLTDWGTHNNLCFLAPEAHFASLDPAPDAMTHAIDGADALAIRSLGNQRFFPESADVLTNHAIRLGKQVRVAATVRDTRGEPKFEILDFY